MFHSLFALWFMARPHGGPLPQLRNAQYAQGAQHTCESPKACKSCRVAATTAIAANA